MSPGKLFGGYPFTDPVKSRRVDEFAATVSPSSFAVVMEVQRGQCQQAFIIFFKLFIISFLKD